MEAIALPIKDPLDQPLPQREAATDAEFVQLVGKVLQSAEVRALIHSLIARINQINEEPQGNGTLEQARSDAGETGSVDTQDE